MSKMRSTSKNKVECSRNNYIDDTKHPQNQAEKESRKILRNGCAVNIVFLSSYKNVVHHKLLYLFPFHRKFRKCNEKNYKLIENLLTY